MASIGGFAGWSNFSDGRYKKNIQEDVIGLDFILALHPLTYQLDINGLGEKLYAKKNEVVGHRAYQSSIVAKQQGRYSGFIAQEVETIAKKLGYEFSGIDAPKNENDFYGLRYAEFVVPLVKAVQEQQLIIDIQKTRLEQQAVIMAKQQLSIDELMNRLQKLEELFQSKNK